MTGTVHCHDLNASCGPRTACVCVRDLVRITHTLSLPVPVHGRRRHPIRLRSNRLGATWYPSARKLVTPSSRQCARRECERVSEQLSGGQKAAAQLAVLMRDWRATEKRLHVHDR
jgi:hypothetical protein